MFRSRRSAARLACLTLFAGAAVAARSSAAVGGDFQLTRLDDGAFRAEYCLDRPAAALRFDRPIDRLRATSWRVEEPAFTLAVADDGTAELRRADGAPFVCAALRLALFTELPPANYYAFSTFSDGGVSVYTGYLMGSALVAGEWLEAELSASYRGRAGERVVTRDPERLVEQFVYFGRQEPLATGAVLAVVDAAMPSGPRARILDTLPAVDAMLAEELGFRPASPYTVFLATDFDAFDGYSIKGGTLADQILFTVKGREAAGEIAREPMRYAKLAAHEVFHLWQNERWFEALGEDYPWVHEGSADALALEALRRSRAMDGAAYAAAWAATEARCVELMGETTVHAGPSADRFEIAYACGALVNRLAGELLDPADPGRGLIAFWRAMAERPESVRRSASEPLFFETLELAGAPASKVAALRALLDLEGADPRAAIAGWRARAAASGAP